MAGEIGFGSRNRISFYLGSKHRKSLERDLTELRKNNIGYDIFVHTTTFNPMMSNQGDWIYGVENIRRELKRTYNGTRK